MIKIIWWIFFLLKLSFAHFSKGSQLWRHFSPWRRSARSKWTPDSESPTPNCWRKWSSIFHIGPMGAIISKTIFCDVEGGPLHKYSPPLYHSSYRDRYENIRLPESATYNLYALRMRLTCPIPEEQNTRGRKIHDPLDSTQMFGLLLPNPMPVIPAFPIYTRYILLLSLIKVDVSALHSC